MHFSSRGIRAHAPLHPLGSISRVSTPLSAAPAAAVHVGKQPWLPRCEQTRGRPHGKKLRLLFMKYHCLRVAPDVMTEVRAGGGARARTRVRQPAVVWGGVMSEPPMTHAPTT